MDKIAIISDIHGNYIALKTVIEDIRKRGIERIFCLGDLVAKGSQPKEALELVRENCEVVIKGNCDDIMSGKPVTKEHKWNIEKIGEENSKYLESLPFSHNFYMSGFKIKLIHASPTDLYKSISYYGITEKMNDEIKEMFNYEDVPDIVIFGHIHSPFLCRVDKNTLINPGSISNGCDIVINKDKKYELSSYMILEGDYNSKEFSTLSYEIVKLPFDFEKEIENLRNSDMPNKEMAIEELETGLYVKR